MTDPLISTAGVVLFSTKALSLSNSPPADSIFAAVPFDDRIYSSNKRKSFDNHTCSQSFVINGKNDIFITAVYSKTVTQQPSKILAIIGGVSGVVEPLLNVIPGGSGAQNIIKAINGAGNPYSNLLSAFNEENSRLQSVPLGIGNYGIKSSNAVVYISVTKVDSVLTSATPSIRRAFDKRVAKVAEAIVTQPTSCVREGLKLERDENYSKGDTVYALSKAVIDSGLSPIEKVTICLTRKYGPAVARTQYWRDNIGKQIPDQEFPLQYSDLVPFDNNKSEDFMRDLRSFMSDPTHDMKEYFSENVIVKDYLTAITPDKKLPYADFLIALKNSGYTKMGCPYDPKDEALYDTDRQPASAIMLIVKGSPTSSGLYNYADALVMTFWWQGNATEPKIFETYINQSNALTSKILKVWHNGCSPAMKFKPED